MRAVHRPPGLLLTAALTVACSSDQVTSSSFARSDFNVGTAAAPAHWNQLASSGAGPVGIVSSVYSPEGDAIIAGNMPDYGQGALWRFDLKTNQWSQIPAMNWPYGKYRNIVYDPTRRQIFTYWNGLGQVYGIPEAGGTWTPQGSATNSDEYYEGYAFFNPVSKRLTQFAGYGFFTFKDLLWEWNGTSWNSLAQGSPRPEGRFGGPVALDVNGAHAFIAGRSRGACCGGNYDDLWSLNLRTNTWTSLIGPFTDSTARLGTALVWVPRSKQLYRFGGCTPLNDFGTCTVFRDELSVAVPGAPQVRWERLPAGSIAPSGRFLAGLHFDLHRNRLLLVSGFANGSWQDDVWARTLK